ncbi:MAG TPA: hypothetical protein VGS59_13980 [Candidatus Acidoferrales bacterium]|nr:hypothetical protein [Candidatus Acidoferrales bacterium]
MVMRVYDLAKVASLDYQRIVEAEGAEFLGVEDGEDGLVVFFYDEQSGQRLSVSARACTPENIRLGLTKVREQVAETPQPVATDIDPTASAVYEHLRSMFDEADAALIAGKLGLRIR